MHSTVREYEATLRVIESASDPKSYHETYRKLSRVRELSRMSYRLIGLKAEICCQSELLAVSSNISQSEKVPINIRFSFENLLL